MAQMQDSQGDCVWGTWCATSSPPDPVEDPEMSETVAQERHEELSGAVSDSDADRRQTLSRPPTLSGPYYEPDTVEGGGFENTFGQSLARPLLTAIDTRRLSTSTADLDSSDGRRSSTPPCKLIPLAKRGDGVTGCQDFAPNPIGGAYSALPALPLLALLASRRDGTGSRFLTLDPTRPASFSPGDPIQSLSELKQILDSEHVSK